MNPLPNWMIFGALALGIAAVWLTHRIEGRIDPPRDWEPSAWRAMLERFDREAERRERRTAVQSPRTGWIGRRIHGTRLAGNFSSVRRLLHSHPNASTLSVTPETLHAFLDYIGRLELDRDAEGNGAIASRSKARIADQQVLSLMAKIGDLVQWAADELGVSPKLEDVLAAIAANRSAHR